LMLTPRWGAGGGIDQVLDDLLPQAAPASTLLVYSQARESDERTLKNLCSRYRIAGFLNRNSAPIRHILWEHAADKHLESLGKVTDFTSIDGTAMECDREPVTQEGALEDNQSRSLAGFEALVERFQDRLVRYAFHRLGSFQDAEDVIQSVFVRAYPHWVKGSKIARVGPYLYRMAVNACTDVLRKRKRSEMPIEELGTEAIPADRTDPSQPAVAAEELRRIEGLLCRIPRRQSEVIRLRVFDELRFAEIAEVLGCRLATVKSQFRYGLQKLRVILAAESEVLR